MVSYCIHSCTAEYHSCKPVQMFPKDSAPSSMQLHRWNIQELLNPDLQLKSTEQATTSGRDKLPFLAFFILIFHNYDYKYFKTWCTNQNYTNFQQNFIYPQIKYSLSNQRGSFPSNNEDFVSAFRLSLNLAKSSSPKQFLCPCSPQENMNTSEVPQLPPHSLQKGQYLL